MAHDANLGLDIRRAKDGTAPKARLCLKLARGYTADGEPTLTIDCESVDQLEHEVARLSAEMADAVRLAAGEFEGRKPAPAPAAQPASGGARTLHHLDTDLRVQDVMTRDVRTLQRTDHLSLAEEMMRIGRFRHAVVLDEDGLLAGVLSQRDLVFNALSFQSGLGSTSHERALERLLAKDLMQTNVVTIAPTAPIGEATALMNAKKVGCLPVMDGPQLVGLLTASDLLALLSG